MNILDELVMCVGGTEFSLSKAVKICAAPSARLIDRKSPGALFRFIFAAAPCCFLEIDIVLVVSSDLARGLAVRT